MAYTDLVPEYMSVQNLILLFLVLGLLYFVLTAIYNVTLHPLAGFPGPKLAAATVLYELYFEIFHGLGAQYYKEYQRMHEVYGPIVRINPDELHIDDPDWFDTAYPRHPIRRDKWPPFAAMLGTKLGTFGTVDHDTHRMRRSATNNFFSTRNMAASEALIHGHLDKMCDLFRESHEKGEPTALRVSLTAFTMDVLCDVAFGDCLHLQNDPQACQDYDRTIAAIGIYAPYAKKFPWMIRIAMNLPVGLVMTIAPALGRIVQLRKVSLELARRERVCFCAWKYVPVEQLC